MTDDQPDPKPSEGDAVARLRALLEAVELPGPWGVHGPYQDGMFCVYYQDHEPDFETNDNGTAPIHCKGWQSFGVFHKDVADLIAAARNHLPAVLAELERLRRLCELHRRTINRLEQEDPHR